MHDMSGRLRFFVHAPHSLHCGVKTEQKQINLTKNSLLSPGIIFSILNPLMDPAWATYHSLEAKTWTSENCLGSLFSTDHKVSPFIIREKKYLDPFFVWLISTAVHSLMGGFFVRKSFPTLGFPLRVVLIWTPRNLWIERAGVRSPTFSLFPPMVICRICAYPL